MDIKVQVSFDDQQMDRDEKPSINATFERMFNVGPSRYAAFKKDHTVFLLKIVQVNGVDEFHDIESKAEFDSVREVFLNSLKNGDRSSY